MNTVYHNGETDEGTGGAEHPMNRRANVGIPAWHESCPVATPVRARPPAPPRFQ